MPLRIVESNRTSELLEALAENLGPARLFRERHVIVPGRHWFFRVKESLVRRHGAFFQVSIQTFDEFAGDVFSAQAPGRTRAVPDTLAAAIFLELAFGTCLQEPVFSPLRAYLLQGGSEICRDVAWQVARRLGELFAAYHAHRPGLVEAWRSGSRIPGGAPESWQRELFLRLIALPDADDGRMPFADEWIRKNLQPARIASELHVVVPLEWTPRESSFVAWMAGGAEVTCYLASPSREFFELARRRDFLLESGENHPLLDAWGAVSARTVALAHELAGYDADARFVGPGDGALGRLQASILDNAPSGASGLDESLQIWRFPSRRLECAAVRADIERRLRADPQLTLADFAVVVPPADGTSPGVEEELEHVFSQEPVLPLHRAHRRSDSENRMLQALQAFLQLPLSQGRAASVLEVVLHPLVEDWTPEEGIRVREWVNASGAVRFWRADDAGPLASGAWRHSWDFALRRLALGVAMAPGGFLDLGLPAGKSGSFGVAALDFQQGQWPVLARFVTLVHGLRAFCEACGTARTMAEWTAFLETQILAFLHPITQKDEKVLARVLEILRRQGELDVWARPDARLDYADVHGVLSPLILRLQVAHSPADGRGVFVGPLSDALFLPFAHVYLVGLEDGVIAGERVLESLDVRGDGNLPGREASMRELELGACLAILCNTSKSVTFSWCDRDPVTADPVAPNVAIRDLMAALRVSETDLPSPPAPELPSLLERECAARIAACGAQPPRTRRERDAFPSWMAAFWKTPASLVPMDPTAWERPVSWRRLAALWNFPLQTVAANWFAPASSEGDAPAEWEPESLDFWESRQWMWDAWIDSVRDPRLGALDRLKQRFQMAVACGRAPAGLMESVSLEYLLQEAGALFSMLDRFSGATDWQMPPLGMDPARFPHTLAALRLEGTFRRVNGILPAFSHEAGAVLMAVWGAGPEVRHVLEAQVAVLVHCALGHLPVRDPVRVFVLFPRKKKKNMHEWTFPAFSPDAARQELGELAKKARDPGMLAVVTADMAAEYLLEQKNVPFDSWYEDSVRARLVDEKNNAPLLPRDPVRDLEELVDAQSAFRTAEELYLNSGFILARRFDMSILPVARTFLADGEGEGEAAEEDGEG